MPDDIDLDLGDLPPKAWAIKETANWYAIHPDRRQAYARIARCNETEPVVALLDIADGRVEPADKAPSLQGHLWARTAMYAHYLQEVSARFCPNLRCRLLLDTADFRDMDYPVPLFAFQKRVGLNHILLPDIDFLGWNFYDGRADCRDDVAFEDKSCTAIFAGSTTGARMTEDVLRHPSAVPRLRAALYFRDNPLVTFKLANITQVDSEETRQLFQATGFGGERISWQEQFRHKFLISMDGNGATCSRVAIALKSNSVLLKYDSPYELYYFSGLKPWEHFIPIRSDDDVVRVVEAERQAPGLFRHIAEAGKRFADTYLTRSATMQYTARLLEHYDSVFSDFASDELASPAAREQATPAGPFVAAVVHIQNTGDVRYDPADWIGDRESTKWIEGLMLDPGPGVSPSDIEYQVIASNGAISDVFAGGEFAGSRAQNTPIAGFLLRLRGVLAERYAGSCSALFIDGSTVGPVPLGERCASLGNVPMQAFKITLTEMSGRGASL